MFDGSLAVDGKIVGRFTNLMNLKLKLLKNDSIKFDRKRGTGTRNLVFVLKKDERFSVTCLRAAIVPAKWKQAAPCNESVRYSNDDAGSYRLASITSVGPLWRFEVLRSL